jgi:thymidylate synthase ThyX
LTKDLIYDLVDQNNKIKPLNNPYIVMSYDSYNETIYISSNLRSYYEWYNYSDDLKRKSVKYIMNLLGKKYDLFFTFPKLLNDDDYMLLNYIEEIDPNTIEDLEIRSYHAYKTIMFVTNRGVSHEVVRHRKSSFTQESSRFCSYDKDKFGNEINFIDPEETINSIIKNDKKYATLDYMIQNKADVINEMRSIYELIEKSYMKLKSLGCPSDVARNVLPIGVKTEIAITQTIHWWREF